MDKVIKHGIQLAAGLTPASQKEMRATLAQIFSEAGSQINFNTPENKKGIQALAHLMRDMFASVGKGDMFDFSKMIESPEKMFKEMGSAAKEFEGVWNDIVTRMGNNSLSSIFMKNQSELSVALDRMEKMSDKARQRIVENMQAAFEPVKSKNVNSLLKSAAGFKRDFESGETWEERTTGALRYLNVYQQIMTLTKGGMDIEKVGADELEILDNIKKIGPYTVKQLESIKPQLQASLQNIFNLSTGKPLIGLTDGGVIDINVAPKVIKELDVGDILGGKENIRVTVVPEIDPDFATKLKTLFDLSQQKGKEAREQFAQLQNEVIKDLPTDIQDDAVDRLSDFLETKGTDRAIKGVWKDFIGFGLPVGSRGDGTGGFGGGIGDASGTGDASSVVGDNSLKQLEKDAEAAAKAFENATNRLHEIYEEERRLNEQIANAGLIDYDEKIQAAGAVRENALNALKQKLPKKADHKGNVDEMQSIVKNMIDKGAMSGISKPTDLYFVEQYMNAVADYSKHTNAELNRLLEKAVSTIDRKTKETIIDYKDAQRRQEEDDPNNLIAQRRKLAEEHAAAAKAYNDAADAKREAYDKFEAAKQRGGSSGDGRTAEDIENARKVTEYEEQARKEAEAREQAAKRRKELAEQMELYSADDGTEFNLEESENQKVALQEILNTLKQENLLTDELRERYDSINAEIDERISLLKSVEQAYNSLETADNIDYNMYDVDEVQQALDKRKEIINAITQNVLDYDDDIVDWVEEIRQENTELEKRIGLLQQVKQGLIDIDSVDDIMSESGDLDSKLSRLQDVADTWGSDIKDADVDEDSDALEALQEFEDTYDRIILKLANGRKIEILPNAKGLRALHKYADGMDSSAYGESEIADVEFVRKEIQQIDHAAQQAKESVAGLNNELTTTGDKADKVDTTSSQTDGATAEEVENLERIREAVSKITAEVKEKTQEFLNEQAAVKKVAESEVHALGEVEKKVTAIRVALSNVNTLLNNVKKGKDVGAGLSNISINVNHKKDGSVKQVPETWALEDTLRNKTNELLGKIVTNTNTVKTNTKDVAKDATLKQALNTISTKIKTTPTASGQSYGNQSFVKSEVTKSGGNLLKMYERLGALGVQKNALALNSEERKGIEEKIRLLKEEIKQKLKLVTVDKQLIVEAQQKGAADQRAQMMTVGGRKSDTQAAKNEKEEINDLLKAYERLGALRAERDMFPKGSRRDELQKEIKSETSRLWKRSKRLGVDSAQTGEAADRGAHIIQMDQLIEKTKLLGQYERDIISMKQGSEAHNNAQSRIDELNKEIALIRKKITLTQEEKLELDALISKNTELTQKKSSSQNDADRKADIADILAKTKELGTWQAKLAVADKNSADAKNAQERTRSLSAEIKGLKDKITLTQDEYEALQDVLKTNREIVKTKLSGKQTKDDKKRLADEQKTYQKEAMVGKAGNAVSRAENTLIGALGVSSDGGEAIPAEFKGQIDEYHIALKQLRQTQAALQKMKGPIEDDDQKNLIAQINNVNKLTDEISELISQYHRLSGENSTVIGTDVLGNDADLNQYRQQLEQAVKVSTNGKAQITGFDNATRKLTYTVKTGKNEFTEYTAEVRGLDNQLVATQGTTKKTETFFEATMRKMKEISSYMSGMTILSRLGQELKRGVQYVREIDSALVELRKVTDETDETYDKFLRTAAKTGSVIGATISEVTDATATFSKLGYELETATEMAESAIVYKNVGDNIASAEDAADSIISTLKGFGLEASESMRIVDRFNEVGNRFAITSQGIGEALRLSASALSEGGNSLDESIGLITAANEVVNDPSSVGTALKTLTLRLRGSKTELEEMGEDVTDMATTTSALQAKLLALTGGKVDIMLDETTFKNSTQILREMSEAWEDMDDISRASALELMGGKRQANVLSALIQNFDTVESAIESSAQSSGSALRENEIWLDSIEGRISQFNNSVQSMWNNTLDSDWLKRFIAFGTTIINIIDKIELLNVAIFGLFTYLSNKKNGSLDLASILGIHDKEKGWTFGKDGLTGKVKEKFKKKNVTEDILGNPKDVEVDVKEYAESIRDNINEYVTVDTSQIDTQIDNIQNKLNAAREQLDDAKAKDWDYYKSMGSSSPAQDRDNRILEKQQEIASLEKNLASLQAERSKTMSDAALKYAETNINGIKAETQAQRSLFEALDKVKNVKLSMGNEQDAALKIDQINQAASQGQVALSKYAATLGDSDMALQAYIASLNGEQASLSGFNKFIQQHNLGVKSSGLAAKAAAIGHAALNAAISMGISLLISGAISLVSSWANAVEEAAKAARDAIDAYKEANNTLRDNKKTIEEIKDDYAELADGVDNLGRNVGLSADEYERYNEITNKIAEMFPEMVTGYTDEGNAIIALKGNVDELTKAYEAEAKAARDAILVSQGKVYKDFLNNSTTDVGGWSWNNHIGYSDYMKVIEAYIDDAAGRSTIVESNIMNEDYFDFGLRKMKEDLGFDPDALDWEASLTSLQALLRQVQSEANAATIGVRSVLNAYLEQDWDYLTLSDQGKSIAQSIISGFDTEFYSQFKSAEEMEGWISANVIKPLQDAGNMAEFTAAFDLQTRFNDGSVPVDQYLDEINKFIELLETLGFDEDIVKTVKGIFEIDDYTTKINSAKDILDNDGDSKVGTLSKSDLDIIDKNKTQWKEEYGIDDNTLMSWEDLTNAIQKAKDGAWEASVAFDEVSKGIDNIQDAYSTLTDVVTQYNESGYLSLDNLQALLSLEPEYLAVLQMENGQLSINQSALEALIQTKLAEAKATTVQNAITQLNALAAKTEADAINDSANAANNAISGLGTYADSLGIVAQNAIGAAGAVGAFNAAVEGAQGNELVKQEEIDAILSSMNTQLQMIDSVGSNLSTNFGAIVDPDTSSSDSDDESELDKLQDKYDALLSNIENKQTYIQNEIDKLEAEGETVPLSYYEKLVSLEEEKMALYSKQRTELNALLATQTAGTEEYNETAKALWEVEHSLQDSTKAAVEYRKEMTRLYETAFDDIAAAYSNKDDFLSNQQSYIDKYNEYMELLGESPTVGSYNALIDTEEQKMADNYSELESLRSTLADGVASDKIKEGSEEWIKMQSQIRRTEADILDNKIAIEQYNKSLKEMPIENFETMREAFSVKDNFLSNQQSYIEGYAELLETQGVDVPQSVYDELISLEKKKQKNNIKNLKDARKGLADIEAAGYTAADEEWQDAYQKVVDIEKGIQDSDIAMAKWNQTILDADFSKYEEFLELLQDLNTEISNLDDIVSRSDAFTDDGEWTEAGVTSLGLKYQKYTSSKDTANDISKDIADLNDAYENKKEYDLMGDGTGVVLNDKQYKEQLKKLTDAQWESISEMYAAQDAMIAMEEERINVVEEAVNKEIEAYQDLIDAKKEELDAERDLYEFRKDIKNQTKDIAELERRIASLSGSTAASDIAERRKLEAELAEKNEGLNDTYYNHAKDSQSSAIDDEIEAFKKVKDDYVESLREALENTEEVFKRLVNTVGVNGDIILDHINDTAEENGITLSVYLTDPWKAAAQAAIDYKGSASGALGELIGDNGVITLWSADATSALASPWTSAATEETGPIAKFKTAAETAIDAVKLKVTGKDGNGNYLGDSLDKPWLQASQDGKKTKSPITTFSDKAKAAIDSVVTKAKAKIEETKSKLGSPWKSVAENGAINTFSNKVGETLDNAILKAEQAANDIKAELDIDIPDIEATVTTTYKTVYETVGTPPGGTITKNPVTQTAQLKSSGKTFTAKATANTKSEAQKQAKESVIQKAYDYYKKQGHDDSWLDKKWSTWNKSVTYHAKGTMATTRDEWAITDEPRFGDELVLVPGKDGNLSFMRKGTGVVPADLTQKLFELAQIPMSDLTNRNMTAVVPNITKNNFKNEFNFESLVHVDKVDSDTLPKLEKMVDKKIDDFSKALNYSIKKFTR